MKIVLIGGLAESLVNFRGDLIRNLVGAGHEVITMAAPPTAEHIVQDIETLGCRFQPIPINRASMSPMDDLRLSQDLYRAFRRIQPELILAYTIKPVIWGGLAARRYRRARFFAMITGLGFAFQRGSFKRNCLCDVVISLYRMALRRAEGVIFQNPDNRDVFIKHRIVPLQKTHVVYGSGVNVAHFKQSPIPDGDPVFLLVARLLGAKGLREYAEAARQLKPRFPNVTFRLVGPEDPSPDAIPLDEVLSWHQQGFIDYAGSTRDVRPFIQACHVFVLPSYHEGMPRTVLEAMSIGRPILTSDVEGCRETVAEGINGRLVPRKDAARLAEAMVWFIEHRDQWTEMAEESRVIANERFDVTKVNSALLHIMGLRTDRARSPGRE